MTEYGIFNDEGILEGNLYYLGVAEKLRTDRYWDDPHAYVSEVCPDHPDQPKEGCEECDGSDEDESTENDE